MVLGPPFIHSRMHERFGLVFVSSAARASWPIQPDIETAVQKEPVNPVYLKDAGLLCKRAGLSAKAERYLEQAAQWDPDNAEVQAALAELRGGSKESGKGFTLFRKS